VEKIDSANNMIYVSVLSCTGKKTLVLNLVYTLGPKFILLI